MSKTCIIIGGGISGPVAALALSRVGIKCIIYELRDSPATIGGAVSLTPNALKLLSELQVDLSGCVVDSIEIFAYHTGAKLGELSFRGPNGRHSLRVLRESLLRGLLDAVRKAGIEVVYGSKLTSIVDHDDGDVVAVFENGTSAKGDFIIGCDGTYSATRMKYVEPERTPIFTDAASAYAIVDGQNLKSPVHFESTAVNSGQYGALLSSYVDPDKTSIFLSAVMETEERDSKEGWRARGLEHEKTVVEIKRRFSNSAFPCLQELLERVKEYIYYPTYKLGPGGNWSRANVLLLGDAAHGMPPQGESTGLAIEDSILLARVFEQLSTKSVLEVFTVYEKTRRPRIDKAYKQAVFRWSRVKDKSWFEQKIEEWFTRAFLWYMSDDFEKSFAYDIRKEEILL